MSIPFSRYVNIVSGVGGGATVRQRDLILRLFTSSPFIGPDTVLEFDRSNLAAIATLFGSTSPEYLRAAAYFGYVSPAISAPERIAFASYRPVAVGAAVFGNTDPKSLSELQNITAGAFRVTLAGVQTNVSAVDFSAEASFAAIAAELQTVITGAGLAGATVTFAANRFVVQFSGPGTVEITPTVSGANDIATLLGLSAAVGAINVTGSGVVDAVTAVQQSEQLSDNFGSLVFIPALTITEHEAVSAYVAALNVKYQYHVPVSAANAAAWSAALIGYAGTGITLSPLANEYPELIPPAILAATRYDRRNAVQNYMFKQLAGVTPSVTSATDADTYDALRVNYYGDTSTAGQVIKFYQRGTLCGGTTAPVDMNTYANEQWLKDYAGSQVMGLLLSVGRVPANAQGVGMISNVLQPAIDRALTNGTISVGKTLTAAQRVFLTQATNDPLAYLVVQSQGYILAVRMEPYTTTSGATEYKAVYELYYSKDDAIRRVDGFHTLV
jgi:hypothetical protein